MSTWLEDLKKKDPQQAADRILAGTGDRHFLKNMVRALQLLPALNTTEDTARLAAAKRLLRKGAK